MTKLERIDAEMKKIRGKIADYQNRLKELDGQRTEQENLQIVSLVRAMHMTRDDLTAFLRSGEPKTPKVRKSRTPKIETEGNTNE
ncbi:hypothetical protein FACS1894217_07020 [Clostridia bacterium]|nr:hypothetical protein FACS1894202_11760 [Clostridia bacterium]GHV07059.1 hypothetical protein FACS1894217_07020 [Clostridia bacterium]